MEELGIGRPSTYASIMQTVQDRGYVWKKGSALVPSWIAFAVTGLLESYFSRLVDYGFTASVENDLDAIATGARRRADWLHNFYFGAADGARVDPVRISSQGGLKKLIESRLAEIDARGVNSIELGPEFDGTVVRVGRYGPYLQKGEAESGQRASLPEDLAPDELTPAKVAELLDAPSGDRVLGTDPELGTEVTVKNGRYGPYVTDGERTASLFKTMTPDAVTLADAVRLLTLPRTVGTDAEGEPITAQNGRYGPYLKRGTDSRSLESEEALFTVTMDEALALFAQPKTRGRRAAAAPLRELGDDPATGKPMVVKDGRFGPYVTDGETNASLRRGDDVATLSVERAAELLADRRAAPKKATKRAAKAPAKKAAAKKAPAKKAVAKKASTKAAKD
jgi:DNA topoisomerase-1